MESDSEKRRDLVDPRIYFAAERTLLAWVRTGLSMMGFGFVVARFGLFLREIAVVQAAAPPRQHGLSIWVGTTLVFLGVAVNICAVVNHWHTVRRLDKGEAIRFRSLPLGAIVALLMAVLGLVMAGYLLFGLNRST